MSPITTPQTKIVSREEWLAARKDLLLREKQQTRLRDELSALRRELPWVKIEKNYLFDSPEGQVSLADLFAGRSQLIIKHFMLGPGQKHHCVGCSFEVDQVEGALVHLENHDVSFAVVARAPLDEITALKDRMGWRFKWVSSFGSDFNYDFNVSFTPEQISTGQAYYNYEMTALPIEDLSGFSVFYQSPTGEIFHTYSAFGRGAEEVLTAYMLLDLTPKGRNETGPNLNLTDWVRPHDQYGAGGEVTATGRFIPAGDSPCCCCGVG